jgi:C-terminal topoisomerase domain
MPMRAPFLVPDPNPRVAAATNEPWPWQPREAHPLYPVLEAAQLLGLDAMLRGCLRCPSPARGNARRLKARVQKKKEQIKKAELNAKVKEELSTVALGTSKINYLDPRITVAWCKRNEVPIEKIFNKSLVNKFFWAMDVEPDFKF